MPHVELPQAEFKVVLLGDTNTGKTSLALRFVEGYYKDNGRSPTVGAFFLTKRITVQQTTTCKLLLWDTAGQAQFQRLAKTYYKQAAAAIFTYDVSQPQSLHRLRGYLDEVLQNTAGRRMVLAIAACKIDLDPSLHHPGLQEEAASLAAAHNALYVATSAKTNEGVQALFEQTAERVWHCQKEAAAGIGLPIPVTVGGTVSSKSIQQQQRHHQQQQQRSRSAEKRRSPSSNDTSNLSRPSSSPVPRIDTPPPAVSRDSNHFHKTSPASKTIDSSTVDTATDDVLEKDVDAPQNKSNIMCEGLLTCGGDPGRGCCIT